MLSVVSNQSYIHCRCWLLPKAKTEILHQWDGSPWAYLLNKIWEKHFSSPRLKAKKQQNWPLPDKQTLYPINYFLPWKVTLLLSKKKKNTQRKMQVTKSKYICPQHHFSHDLLKRQMPKVWKSFKNSTLKQAFPFKESLFINTEMVNNWQVWQVCFW